MAINSLNQSIDIRYGAQVLSEGVNSKIKDIFGDKSKIEGLELTPSSGLSCLMAPGKIIIGGVSITEEADIVVTFPYSSSLVTYYLYAVYAHADGATCRYEILTAPTTAASYLLIAKVTIPASTSTIISGYIENMGYSSPLKDAVVFSDRENKVIEEVNAVNIGGAVFKAGNEAVSSETDYVSLDGVLKATRIYNPYLSDYAEYFDKKQDKTFETGEIVALDMSSDAENYTQSSLDNPIVVGVVSHRYAQCIGGDDAGDKSPYFVPVGLSGRVPVQVVGPVKKGDYIYISKFPGVGIAVSAFFPQEARSYAGIAVEDNPREEIKLVKCLIGKV